jgi:uncharacterized membrane protein
VAVVLEVMVALLPLAARGVVARLVELRGLVILHQHLLAKVIMVVVLQVLRVRAAVELEPQVIILLHPALFMVVMVAWVYLALLLAILIIGLAVVVALYLRLELKVMAALVVSVVEVVAVLVTIQEVRLV